MPDRAGTAAHCLAWRGVTDRVREADGAKPGHEEGTWLLLCGGTRFDRLLARRMADAGLTVASLRYGPAY
ncbi:hypothetical protein [Streptomyces spectabilis]|uniref:Uncharacterized protein n=1 Tax=Streptomyces spectabilis TaxID=68270 RepID=A0A7W8B5Q5_STRST|nr:hypothetical protein [Streptomyces spectabilis]MBB5109670.1 hypothetical protein [Streptomyces spectabilis]GGV55118.1 hypothetical protein GCM10010245_87210 [Streptomyces spectabilis]